MLLDVAVPGDGFLEVGKTLLSRLALGTNPVTAHPCGLTKKAGVGLNQLKLPPEDQGFAPHLPALR